MSPLATQPQLFGPLLEEVRNLLPHQFHALQVREVGGHELNIGPRAAWRQSHIPACAAYCQRNQGTEVVQIVRRHSLQHGPDIVTSPENHALDLRLRGEGLHKLTSPGSADPQVARLSFWHKYLSHTIGSLCTSTQDKKKKSLRIAGHN